MRCLILGGAGFMGSHLADALVTRGHTVRVFDRPNVDTTNLAGCLASIEVAGGDFNNRHDLAEALSGMDVVVHLVCTTLPKSSNDNPAYDVETNTIGSIRLLELARSAGIGKIVFASSGGTVYGIPRAQPIAEDHPTDPICSYGITKLSIEKYLYLFRKIHGLDYVVLRMGNPYGERQKPTTGQGAVATFLHRALVGEPIVIWGDGSVARDYLHVSDVVTAFVRVCEAGTPSRIYNIGSGTPRTLLDIVEAVGRATGNAPDVKFEAARSLDVPINYLDISRARRELSWAPTVPFDEGVSRTWQWLRSAYRA